MYRYTAEVVRVIDGDTIDCEVDLGFCCKIRERFRLRGINAPELRKADLAGYAAKEHLEQLIGGQLIEIRTHKDQREKYGRYLADVFLPGGCDVSINTQMVLDGYAIEASY